MRFWFELLHIVPNEFSPIRLCSWLMKHVAWMTRLWIFQITAELEVPLVSAIFSFDHQFEIYLPVRFGTHIAMNCVMHGAIRQKNKYLVLDCLCCVSVWLWPNEKYPSSIIFFLVLWSLNPWNDSEKKKYYLFWKSR